MGGVSLISFLSNRRFSFLPPTTQNVVFQSIRVEKVLMLRISITASTFLILFLLTALFKSMRGVSHLPMLSDLRFSFLPPKPQ